MSDAGELSPGNGDGHLLLQLTLLQTQCGEAPDSPGMQKRAFGETLHLLVTKYSQKPVTGRNRHRQESLLEADSTQGRVTGQDQKRSLPSLCCSGRFVSDGPASMRRGKRRNNGKDEQSQIVICRRRAIDGASVRESGDRRVTAPDGCFQDVRD